MPPKNPRQSISSTNQESSRKPHFQEFFEKWYQDTFGNPLSSQQNFAVKSKAFLEWYVDTFLQSGRMIVPTDTLEDAIVDGANDKGVDLIVPVENEEGSATLIIQSKYYPSGTKESGAGADRIQTMFQGLLKGVVDPNKKLTEALERVDLKKQVIIRYLSNVKPTPDGQERMNLVGESLPQQYPWVRVEWITAEQLTHDIRALADNKEDLSGPIQIFAKDVLNFDGFISAVVNVNQVSEMYRAAGGERLFVENIRNPLKSKLNEKIQKTLESETEAKNFLFYNNGISALATTVHVDKRPTGGYSITLTGVSVINGAQTVSSIVEVKRRASGRNASVSPAVLESAYVQIRLIERSLRGDSADFTSKIVERNNSQNKVTPADQISRDPIQKWIADEFRKQRHPRNNAYVEYQYRRGLARKGEHLVPIVQFAQRLLAFDHSPIAANNSVSRLFAVSQDDISHNSDEVWYVKLFKAGDASATILSPAEFERRSAIWWMSQYFEERRKQNLEQSEQVGESDDHLTNLGVILFTSRVVLDAIYGKEDRNAILRRAYEGKWILDTSKVLHVLFSNLYDLSTALLYEEVSRQKLGIQEQNEKMGVFETFSVQRWRRDKSTFSRIEKMVPASAVVTTKKKEYPSISILLN